MRSNSELHGDPGTEFLSEAKNVLRRVVAPGDNHSIARGASGVAILQAYGVKFGWTDPDILGETIQKMVTAVSLGPKSFGLFHGLTGVAYAMHHVNEVCGEVVDESVLESLDDLLCDRVAKAERPRFELVNGLAGVGLYANARMPRSSASRLLERVVDKLNETAVQRGEGVVWETRPEWLPPGDRSECPAPMFQVGISHGLLGPAAALALAGRWGVDARRTTEISRKAISWMMEQCQVGLEQGIPLFIGAQPDRESVAWCRGRLGFGVALHNVGRLLGDSDLMTAGVGQVRLVAQLPVANGFNTDASLCHGWMGNAIQLWTIGKRIGDDLLVQKAIEYARYSIGKGTWETFDGDPLVPDKCWHSENVGLLNGLSGIALSLLALAEAVDLAWSRPLFIDVRVP